MEAVGNWRLQVDLVQEPFLVEYMNIMAVATQDAGTATVYFATLKGKVVNQIMNAINFEELKARAMVIILRNKVMGTQLHDGIMEKGKVENGEIDGCDCLMIRG
jgi:hypothetical protein